MILAKLIYSFKTGDPSQFPAQDEEAPLPRSGRLRCEQTNDV